MRGHCLQCGFARIIRADGLCFDCRQDNDELDALTGEDSACADPTGPEGSHRDADYV